MIRNLEGLVYLTIVVVFESTKDEHHIQLKPMLKELVAMMIPIKMSFMNSVSLVPSIMTPRSGVYYPAEMLYYRSKVFILLTDSCF